MKEAAKKWFEGRSLLIATRHGKEAVIAPVLEQALGVRCTVPDDYDTDRFGTFTGEVERVHSPLETARQKCTTAMRTYRFDLAVASEGSFGAHPAIGFVPCNEELLILIDSRYGFEIAVKELSTDIRMDSAAIADETALEDFAERNGFPAHGLVMLVPETGFVAKGITDPETLLQTFRRCRAIAGTVRVETDMRAMHNPTRMNVIRKAALKLAETANVLCPACSSPGYGINDTVPGLPCGQCGRPTGSTRAYRYACRTCGRNEQVPRTDKQNEDAAFCDYCNP